MNWIDAQFIKTAVSALMHARSKHGIDIAATALLAARDHADADEQALYFDLIFEQTRQGGESRVERQADGQALRTRERVLQTETNSQICKLKPADNGRNRCH